MWRRYSGHNPRRPADYPAATGAGGSRDLAYLKDYAGHFNLVTIVHGAITGVGLWWTMGLASPLADDAAGRQRISAG